MMELDDVAPDFSHLAEMDKNKIKECEEWLTRSKKASEERIANLEGLKQQLEDMAEPELGVESETAECVACIFCLRKCDLVRQWWWRSALSENVNQRVQDLLRQVEAITNELEREMQEKRRSHELQMRQLLDEQAELHKQMVQQVHICSSLAGRPLQVAWRVHPPKYLLYRPKN